MSKYAFVTFYYPFRFFLYCGMDVASINVLKCKTKQIPNTTNIYNECGKF